MITSSRPRLTAEQLDPRLRRLLDELAPLEAIDPIALVDWFRLNMKSLRAMYAASGGTPGRFDIWLRQEYVRQHPHLPQAPAAEPEFPAAVAARPVAGSPAARQRSAGSLIGFFYELARRKLFG